MCYAIHRIPDCEIVALCDRELLMAKQLGERCGVSARFSDLKEMLQIGSARCRSHHDSATEPLFSCSRMSQSGKPCLC